MSSNVLRSSLSRAIFNVGESLYTLLISAVAMECIVYDQSY